MRETTKAILTGLKNVLEKTKNEEIECFLKELTAAHSIFIYGIGRSGLVGRALAMRLMHLDLKVHFVGEVTTPPIKPGDLLVTISGSGETAGIKVIAKVALKREARLVCLTANRRSSLAKKSHLVVHIPTRVKRKGGDWLARQVRGDLNLTPLGTLFELASMVFCDTIVAELIQRFKKTEEEVKSRHTNLE